MWLSIERAYVIIITNILNQTDPYNSQKCYGDYKVISLTDALAFKMCELIGLFSNLWYFARMEILVRVEQMENNVK